MTFVLVEIGGPFGRNRWSLTAVTGLIEIEAIYKRLHAERMMMDKCHGKQLEFVFD